MRNIRLHLSYDGANYHGWQTQPGRRTIQETLEKAISELTGESRVSVKASGRTDAGVHAVGQVANFHTTSDYSVDIFFHAVNARLPEDIVIIEVDEVAMEFDAIRDATSKLYRYVIHNGKVPNPFMLRYCCHVRRKLDVDLMRKGLECLRGTHDFRSFESEWPNRTSSVRTVTHLAISRADEWIWLDVEADGFLYNMVRTMAGTLINVGRGHWPPERVAEILEARDRNVAGPKSPPAGLFLMRVNYD